MLATSGRSYDGMDLESTFKSISNNYQYLIPFSFKKKKKSLKLLQPSSMPPPKLNFLLDCILGFLRLHIFKFKFKREERKAME